MQTLPVQVIETSAFADRVKSRLTREEWLEAVYAIAAAPETGKLLRGGGGLRKIRIATRNRGKSGGVRVIYYYHPPSGPVFLLDIYAKNEKDDLTDREVNELATWIKEESKKWAKPLKD